jgi:formyltetrahydrofolate synthetase
LAPTWALKNSSTSSAGKRALRPDAVVLVATLRALKYHGGVDLKELNQENLEALEIGFANLERHVHNIRQHYGLPCVVAYQPFHLRYRSGNQFVETKTRPIRRAGGGFQTLGGRWERRRRTSPGSW